MEPQKHPGGRPQKTTDDLVPDWREQILALGSVGGSEVEMRVAVGAISDDLWYRLIKDDLEFSRTVKEARLKSEAWWASHGHTKLENEKFNSTLWYMNMKNRFGWRDKQDVTSDGEKMSFKIEIVDTRKDDE